MSLVNKFKNFIGYDNYDEEFMDEEYVEQEHEEEFITRPRSNGNSTVPNHPDNPYNTPANAGTVSGDSSKVVNIHSHNQLQVVLVKPERFEDASEIADHLNAKRTVVLNLEDASKDVTRRLTDFLSGVAYANDGQIQRVATGTFIITPCNVDIMGDLLDEIENSGVFF